MLKAVVDANVWISALLTPGKPRDIQQQLKEARFQLFFANELLAECLDVIARPKFLAKIKSERRDSLIDLIREQATFVQLPHPIPAVCRDPDDDMYLACAAVSDCDYIVTGDPDLLELGEHGRTKIVNPSEFLRVLADFSSPQS